MQGFGTAGEIEHASAIIHTLNPVAPVGRLDKNTCSGTASFLSKSFGRGI